jgi:hypothetical protein
MSAPLAKVQVPTAHGTPRNICIIIFLNLYGSWQANSIFTAGDFGRLGEEGKFFINIIYVYTPRAA